MCLIELIFISLVPNPLVPLDFSLSIFGSRKIVIILNWWSRRKKQGVFLLSLLNDALDLFGINILAVFLLGGNAIYGLLKL